MEMHSERPSNENKKRNRSELKLFLSHGRMERKHGFRQFKYLARCVYQGNILSELRNSCSCLEVRSNISITTHNPQNSILSAVLKINRRQECANPGRLVDGVSMLQMAGDYYLKHKFCNINFRINSNVKSINHHINHCIKPEWKSNFRIVRFLYWNCFWCPKGESGVLENLCIPV